ncbi:MAG: GNAT family N-acetyltransferase, partial [Actinobacteria bacterium]|nr:GNAT family N-acetyltransferase [Actinomycetota bacterium]
LSVLESLRQAGPARFGDSPPFFGWHTRPDGTADGAVLQTPPYALLLARIPAGSVHELIAAVAADHHLPSAVNLASADQAAFLAAWTAVTGGIGSVRTRTRLYRLEALTPPDAGPPGAARLARTEDRDLLVSWHEAFRLEALGAGPEDPARTVAERLSYGGLLLWEVDGKPVAMAGLTRVQAGVARVVGVYTPSAHRRRGYGGAITTAASKAALAAGATHVVLFTDLANETSNALYQRLGYRPVEDRALLGLTAEQTVTGGGRARS